MIITNLESRLHEIEDATIPGGSQRPAAKITFGDRKWTVSVDYADADEYQEQGEYGDWICVQHLGSMAKVSVCGVAHPDLLISALLEFVRTETPVPA